MSNQLENKQRTLAQILAANRLTKIAGDQTIKHLSSPTKQDSLGAEQEAEAKAAPGDASVQNQSAKEGEPVQTPPNDPASPGGCSFKYMNRTGTKVETMDQTGTASDLPKCASADAYRTKLAGIIKMMDKRAAAAQPASITTAGEVMNKIASLDDNATDEQLKDLEDTLNKLAATNPLFNECRDYILMNKMAEDVAELAETEGISPEEAADLMDQAVEQDPSIGQDLEDEADAEAVQQLADAEEQGAQFADDVQAMADNASANLGVEVTADDIVNAIDEVEAQAEEMGVSPEALIQAAAEELQAQSEVTPEDEEEAQQILDDAAEHGVSPDEVIQMASDKLAEGGDEGSEPEDAGEEKKASYKPTRAGYVSSLIHGRR